MKNIHWPAVGALALSVAGFIAANSDTIAHYVPPKYSGAVIGAGLVAQFIVQSGNKASTQSAAAALSGYVAGTGRDIPPAA